MYGELDLPTPSFARLESYPRRPQHAVFDRLDYTIDFMPGYHDVGAVIRGFINSIPNHDNIVKEIEEQMLQLKELKKTFLKTNRLFRNIDSAWNKVLLQPTEFEEYCALLPKMDGIEERIKLVKNEKVKVKLLLDLNRFKELEPVNMLLLPLKKSLDDARKARDIAADVFNNALNNLSRLKEREKELSSLITDDHIVADEKKIVVADVFPNLRTGYILVRVNDTSAEMLSYKAVMQLITRSKQPHMAVFMRYDYRYNVFSKVWESLKEVRDYGQNVEDPMIESCTFIHYASIGNKEKVKEILLSGIDPNAIDYTNATALYYAALNQHADIVKLLHSVGGNIDCRDKDMMTPLLGCVQKGYVEITKVLIVLGAKIDLTDKNNRGALYYAVYSENYEMIKIFLNFDNRNMAEKVWNFTPLHIAASLGSFVIAKFLVNFGCSIYSTDLKGRSPEEVALDSKHKDTHQFLADERLNAPGQLVHHLIDINVKIWIGDFAALDPSWVTDVGITHLLICTKKSGKNSKSQMGWLSNKSRHSDDDEREPLQHVTFALECSDDDSSSTSWENLSLHIQPIVQWLSNVINRGDSSILISDTTGISTCVAVFAITLLLHSQVPINDSLKACAKARPCIELSPSLHKGLDKLQQAMDEKRMIRMKAKVRNSKMLSIAF